MEGKADQGVSHSIQAARFFGYREIARADVHESRAAYVSFHSDIADEMCMIVSVTLSRAS